MLTMKKICLFIIFFSVSIGTSYANVQKEKGGLLYELDKQTKTAVVISQNTYPADNYPELTDVTIPAFVRYRCRKYRVTGLAANAFAHCQNLQSVTLPEGLTTIGNGAFNCCYALTETTLPNSLQSIGTGAFSFCNSLQTIIIPDNVTSIGKGAFKFCKSLTSVTLPKGLRMLEENTFEKCSVLPAINIPGSVQHIMESAFSECTDMKDVHIPESVRGIGAKAFEHCTALDSITLPRSIRYIEHYAFYDCALTSIYIPENVNLLGVRIFESCNINSITVAPENKKFDSRDNCNAIIETAGNKLIEGCKNTIIPASVTAIGNYAFYMCDNLTSIEIPDSVTSIGEYAFRHCTHLTQIKCNAITPPACGEKAFDHVNPSIPVYVPAPSVSAYREAEGWKYFTNIIPADNVLPE